MNITYEDVKQWAKDSKDPLVKEGYFLAAEEIRLLSSYRLKYKQLKEQVLNSNWSRMEQSDYKYYEMCNFCDTNLTKDKVCTEGCALTNLFKDSNDDSIQAS